VFSRHCRIEHAAREPAHADRQPRARRPRAAGGGLRTAPNITINHLSVLVSGFEVVSVSFIQR
jgi:hypothetical protein